MAENTLLPRTEPEDRRARTEIQRAGLELDADAAPCFEGTPQHEQLRLGVGRRALERPPKPGPADLDAAVGAACIAEPRAADDLARRSRYRGEWQRGSRALLLQRFRQITLHGGTIVHP